MEKIKYFLQLGIQIPAFLLLKTFLSLPPEAIRVSISSD